MHWQKKEINNTVSTETEWEFISYVIKFIHLEKEMYNEPCTLMLWCLLKAKSFHVMVFLHFIYISSPSFYSGSAAEPYGYRNLQNLIPPQASDCYLSASLPPFTPDL